MRIYSLHCPSREIWLELNPLSRFMVSECQKPGMTILRLIKEYGKRNVNRFLDAMAMEHMTVCRAGIKKGKSGYIILVHWGLIRLGGESPEVFLKPLFSRGKVFSFSNTPSPFTFDSAPIEKTVPPTIKTEATLIMKSSQCRKDYGIPVKELIYKIRQANPGRTINSTDQTIEKSCKTISMLVKKDGFNLQQVQETIEWAIQDSFWKKNVYSLASLRKRSKANGNTKFENIRNSFLNEVPYTKDQGFGKVKSSKVQI